MEGTRRKLVILTRLNLMNAFDGHVIYFRETLSSVISLNYFSEIVVLVEEGVKVFLKDVRVMDFLSPDKVVHTGNARNFSLIKSELEDSTHIQYWYLPKPVFILSSVVLRKKNVIFFPDSWSCYFSEKYKYEKQILDRIRSISYFTLEYFLSKITKVVLISESEAKIYNGYHFPHLLKEHNDTPFESIKHDVFIGRMSKETLISLCEKVVKVLDDVNFTVLVSCKELQATLSIYPNLNILDRVNNYEEFTKKFKIHLIYDAYGSGMSTKLINGVNTNRLVLGNPAVFRGFENLPFSKSLSYTNWEEAVETLSNVMENQKSDYYNLIDGYTSLRAAYGNAYRSKVLVSIYE